MTVGSASGSQATWSWAPSRFGGGGYITGLALDPFDARRLYARCDVAGAFVSADGGAHWHTINAGLTLAHEHMVHALVPSPHHDGLLLRCSGDARGGRTYGSIHRSTDYGKTWTQVCTDIDFNGDGATRMFSDPCAFDPHAEGRALVGGYRAGVWVSKDSGLTWRYRGLQGERIAAVVYHPTIAGRAYVGTVGDRALSGLRYMGTNRPLAEIILEHGDIPRGSQGRLYVTHDGGETWNLLYERDNWSVNALEIDPEHPDLLVVASCDGIWRSEDAGAHFSKCEISPECDGQLDFVSRDPHQPGRFLTSPHFDGANIPLYESVDGALTWRRLHDRYSMSELTDYPPYIDRSELIGTAISRVVFDPQTPGNFYMTGYFGVSATYDNGRTFTGHGFRGIETVCAESIISDRARGRIYVTMADHTPAVSVDAGASFQSLDVGPAPTAALAVSNTDSQVLLWGSGSKRLHAEGATIQRSTDGGKTCTQVISFTGRKFVQALASDPVTPRRFYAFVDGDIEGSTGNSAGVYRSDDEGETWAPTTSPFPATLHRLPLEESWIESELLPVVVYQKRNAAGANQLLAVDPHCQDTVYVGEWTLGLYRSHDAGHTWQSADSGLPFGKSRTAVLSHVVPDPLRPGWIYAGFIEHGLWRSTDFGCTWARITPEGTLNASSIALWNDRIVLVCEPMWWTSTPARVLVSEDVGATWQDIHPHEHGAVRWKAVALDANGGIHAASCGNGMFTARLGQHRYRAEPQ